MEILLYIAKSAGILAVFYSVYFFVLRKETLFTANRHFLLGGIVAAFILPSLTYTKTIYLTAPTVYTNSFSNFTSFSPVLQEPEFFIINWWQVLLITYAVGCLIMIARLVMQLVSLINLLQNQPSEKKGNYTYIKVTDTVAPFSFFKYIVYNPELHTLDELEMILKHEETHAAQWHSIDILLANLCRAFQWANPLSWFYKKGIEANLEFIADSKTAAQVASKQAYQIALVKASSSLPVPALTNNFYHSFIKKRIIMLNKSHSKSNSTWKLSIILPLLALFFWSFNVKEEVKYIAENTTEASPKTEIPVLQFDATSSESELDAIETYFSEKYPKSLVKIANRKRDASGNLINFSFQTKFEKETRFYTRFDRGNGAPFQTVYKIEPQENDVLLVSEIGKNGVQLKITKENLQFSSTENLTFPSEKEGKALTNSTENATSTNRSTENRTLFAINNTTVKSTPEIIGSLKIVNDIIKKKITKTTTEAELKAMKKELKKRYGAIINYKTERNRKDEIIAITIDYKWEDESGNFTVNDSDGVEDFIFYLDKENDHYGFYSEENEARRAKLHKLRDTMFVERKKLFGDARQIRSEGLAEAHVMRKESLEEAKVIRKKMMEERKELMREAKGDRSEFMALRKKMVDERKTLLEEKDKLKTERSYFQNTIAENENGRTRRYTTSVDPQDNQPIYVVDGVITTNGVNDIEPNTIKKINILKNKMATDKYGEKATYGVVEITRYKLGERISNQGNPLTRSYVQNMLNKKGVLILKDGKEISRQEFNKLDSSNITSVFTVESDKAIEKFGDQGKNGAIVITTKNQ